MGAGWVVAIGVTVDGVGGGIGSVASEKPGSTRASGSVVAL